jgi:hypothetical protein
MAEEILVKESLTPEMVRVGEQIVRALDNSRWPVVSAFWLFDPEQNRWRLIIASPEVGLQGPRNAYIHIGKALQELHTGEISLHDISVRSPDDKLVKIFASAVSTGPEMSGIRFSRNAIDGRYIEDAFIYRSGER